MPAPAAHFSRADNVFKPPITAFNQDVGTNGQDHPKRCVVTKRGDERDCLKCRQYRHAVADCVNGPVETFGEPPDRSIVIDRDHQACAQRACLRKIGNMAAMQNIKYAVGKNHGSRQLADVVT